ncbi:TTL domain-containing protein [Trichocladium antarcticum]|uniref:TTL domain-containing protein n=1 Tax=Trichocladium antarcticum TaxID=1450529 RepID=A0AAN6ZFU0_9PEZI|nr:TTL domain-containing protein [Trichocladium antarcticum]
MSMHAYIGGASPWLDKHLKSFIRNHVPDAVFVDTFEQLPADAETIFQYCDGWELNQNFAILNGVAVGLINAYPNSDALARKDYLARAVEYWTAKRPDSILKGHVPLTVRLSLDYSEYVDDSLAAADDLTLLYSLEQNAAKAASDREWWILKPALVDCGAGIRLFSTIDELAGHLELAEYEDDDDEDEEEEEEEDDEQAASGSPRKDDGDGVFTPTLSTPGLSTLDGLITTTTSLTLNPQKSAAAATTTTRPKKPQYIFKANGRIPSAQMREFVAQQYIVAIPPISKRKWHVRAYVLAVGRLQVFVFREMLTLLAAEDYAPPWEGPSLRASLTNTALQDEAEYVGMESMRDFWDGVDEGGVEGLAPGWKAAVWEQVCGISGEVFRAAVHTMADKFTTVDKCFELFALDFLVDRDGTAWLLEANETPAFYEQGIAGPLALRLMESVVCVTMEHMGKAKMGEEAHVAAKARMVQVLDESATLAKSNITEIGPEEWGY